MNFMPHEVTLIPGDGIGPEVTKATVRILEATGLKFEWESFMAGRRGLRKIQRIHSQGTDLNRSSAPGSDSKGQ